MAHSKTHPALTIGAWVDGYQLQGRAPVDFITGQRSRYLRLTDGGPQHYVRGSFSDPWWGYDPERGWAVAKRWQNKTQTLLDWTGSGHRAERVEFPARDEVVVEPYAVAA
jgi:hypothetical protein